MDLLTLASDVVIRAESEGDGWGFLGFIPLLAGPVFFWLKYIKYRNTDKRHKHETETTAEMANVQASDEFVQSFKGVRNSRMAGANNHAVRGARKGGTSGLLQRGLDSLDNLGGFGG